ncbi:MAG: hypothetical protein HYZ69_03285 [Candidatus Colwellbacteria bacterium]|nr:hypothetical protein [Candidatus Colwellbacteria bacterium]
MARNDSLVPAPVRNVGYGILGLAGLYVGLKAVGIVWSITSWAFPVAAIGLVGYGAWKLLKD